MDIINYKFEKKLDLRWNDLDSLGHVNNVYYFEYFQIGRSYFMTEISEKWDWTKHMFVIANINCNYFKEIKITSINPSIKMKINKIGTKSFEIDYLIISYNKDNSVNIHAQGTSTQVLIDPLNNKTIEIPDWLKVDLEMHL